jgi:hypothetical protein
MALRIGAIPDRRVVACLATEAERDAYLAEWREATKDRTTSSGGVPQSIWSWANERALAAAKKAATPPPAPPSPEARTCPKCDAPADDDAKFCAACGGALDEEPVPEPEAKEHPYDRAKRLREAAWSTPAPKPKPLYLFTTTKEPEMKISEKDVEQINATIAALGVRDEKRAAALRAEMIAARMKLPAVERR